MIRILTRQGDVLTSPLTLAAVEQALADPQVDTIEVPNRFGCTEPVAAADVVLAWEAGPIEVALGRRRTAKEVVREIIHDTPGIDRQKLRHNEAWRLAGWGTDPHPHTVDTALRQLAGNGELTCRFEGEYHLTAEGAGRVRWLREGRCAAV